MGCYRGLQDGDLVDIEAEPAQRLHDGVAVGGETAISLMGFGLQFYRKLFSGEPEAGSDHAEFGRVEFDLQYMCRNGNRTGRLGGRRRRRNRLPQAVVRSECVDQSRRRLVYRALRRRREALFGDNVDAPGGRRLFSRC
jgi:hypothetical protein